MQRGEKGYTLIEVVIACALAVIIAGGSWMTFGSLDRSNRLNNNYLAAVNRVQMAGDRLSRDAQSAEIVTVGAPGTGDLVIFNWQERSFEGGESVQHMVRYYFEDISAEGLGTLKRQYWNDLGTDSVSVMGTHFYFNPSDPAGTCQASYSSGVLTVRLRAVVNGYSETREYRVARRTSFAY